VSVGIPCPFCDHKFTRVTDTRSAPHARSVKRRRLCLKCHERFTTYETTERPTARHELRQLRRINGELAGLINTLEDGVA
jgi:transcriptional regulator NrdR family protein